MSCAPTVRVNVARGSKRVGEPMFDAGPQFVAGGLPRSQTAVQDRHTGVAEPAQQPPRARRERAVAGVVRDNLSRGADAPATERRRERGGVGQRVAPADARDQRAGQVRREVGKHREWNVGGRVDLLSVQRIRQRRATIEHAPIGRREMGQ